MALPTKTNLLTLDYDDRGLPFVWVEAKNLSTTSLDIDDRGLPFYGASGAAPSSSICKVWTGSAWMTATAKRWTGSAWESVVVKAWNGSSWVGG